MFTGWEWSPGGATVSLLHTVHTAFIWSGHCSCRHNNNTTTLHNIPEYGLQQTHTMFHATTLSSKLCIISVITPICTSYRVLYNIYCEVYQESNQKLFKLIENIEFYFLFTVCSVQQATIREYFPFSFFELSNFRI